MNYQEFKVIFTSHIPKKEQVMFVTTALSRENKISLKVIKASPSNSEY